jgi:hypothetical protein
MLPLLRIISFLMPAGLRYAGAMKHPDCGGLTAVERTRRKHLRLAAEMIEAGATRRGGREAVRLLDAAHQQLRGPAVLACDKPDTHVSRVMVALAAGLGLVTGRPRSAASRGTKLRIVLPARQPPGGVYGTAMSG